MNETPDWASLTREQILSRRVAELEAEVERLRVIAYTDDLTGLPNRRAINEAIASRIKDTSTSTAVVMVDVNGLKGVNDSLGHARGDELLRTVASVLTAGVTHADAAGRLGGDEFVIVSSQSHRDLMAMLESIAEEADRRALGVAIGVASTEFIDCDGPRCLLKAADEAMYRAKSMRMSVSISTTTSSLHECADA